MTAISTSTHKPLSFSLRFLFLVTTFTAACCTLIAIFPGIGILLAIVMMSAFARTCLIVQGQHERGRPATSVEQVGLFAGLFLRVALAVLFLCVTLPLLICSLTLLVVVVGVIETFGWQLCVAAFGVVILAFLVISVSGMTRGIWASI